MKLKIQNIIVYVLLLFLCFSCHKEQDIDPNKALFEKFDGRYAIFAASSEYPIDVSLDGVADTDMLKEILNLKNSDFYIIISKKKQLFECFWSEQFVSLRNEPQGPVVDYGHQGMPLSFEFNADNTELILTSLYVNTDEYLHRAPPVQMKFINPGVLRIKLQRVLYTSQGDKTITIDALYRKDPNYVSTYSER